MMPDRVRIVHDVASGVEAVHARFSGHAYDLHRHDEWLIGVTDYGLQDFFCRGRRLQSTPGHAILIEPGEIHDGRAGDESGFSYSMLYLPAAWVRAGLADRIKGEPAFRATLSDDPALARAIRCACDILGRPPERLARDAALDDVLEALCPHVGSIASRAEWCRDLGVARRTRDTLHDLMAEQVGADALARAVGAADRFQLARAFRAAYGTSPHAYLVQIRLMRARSLLRAGTQPATVAAECGFADQSHLGRWFRRAYGLTPAAYRHVCTGVPDEKADRDR